MATGSFAKDGAHARESACATSAAVVEFRKNSDSEHGFDDQHEVNGRKSCSVFVILTDPDDFRIKNHDFSASATNCPVLVIKAVQNVKITFFRQLPRSDRFFVTFL